MTAPGWYPDPAGSGQQRYFDGAQWGAYKPKKSNTWWIVLLSIFGGMFLLCGGCVGLIAMGSDDKGDEDRTSAASTSSRAPLASPAAPTAVAEQPSGPTVASEGSTVRDGKFEFQVLSVASAPTVGDAGGNPYMQETAQGVFVVLTVRVTNIGDVPQSYFGQNQTLFDTQGRQYDPNTLADMYMNDERGDINPGNSIEVRVAFDVAPGTTIEAVEFHDSMFSGGVQVAVSGSA